MLVHQDREQLRPDLLARLVVRSTGLRCFERLGPVVGAQPDVRPVGLDRHPLGGRVLVEPDGRLDRLHHVRGRLQAGHLRVGLDRCRGSLGDEVPQGAGLHALLSQAGENVGDVGQVGLVRTDEQHVAPVMTEAGVGVEEVGGAVQRDDGLPRTRTAVDDESAAGARADDGVLVGLDGAEHVSHPGRPAAAQAGDEGGLVVERGVPFKPVRGEHLVPVVADPAEGPAIPAPAGQAHRVGVGRPEERLSRGGTPVEQQLAARAVPEAKPSDVHGVGVVRADDAPEAQVQAEAAQDAQASAQPVDLHIPVHRLLAYATGRLALGSEAAGQVGGRQLEALRDGREVLLVASDQRRVGLGGEAVGKVKRAASQRVHVISSEVLGPGPAVLPGSRGHRRLDAPASHTPTAAHAFRDSQFPQVLAPASDYAARPGPCRKPPGALYVESGEECALSFPFIVRCRRTASSRSRGGRVRRSGPGRTDSSQGRRGGCPGLRSRSGHR